MKLLSLVSLFGCYFQFSRPKSISNERLTLETLLDELQVTFELHDEQLQGIIGLEKYCTPWEESFSLENLPKSMKKSWCQSVLSNYENEEDQKKSYQEDIKALNQEIKRLEQKIEQTKTKIARLNNNDL